MIVSVGLDVIVRHIFNKRLYFKDEVLSTVVAMDSSTRDGTGLEPNQGIQLHVSPDKVVLNVGQGQTLSKDALLNSLQQAGVNTGIDDLAISAAVSLSQRGQAIIDNIIARQIDPKPCKPARIEQLISMGQVAMPGDVIQRLVPGDMGKNGTSVTGDVIEAPPAASIKLQAGENTVEVGYELQAKLYGMVKVQGGAVHITPPIHISPDKLSANIDFHPQSPVGTELALGHVLQCLEAYGITYGIDEDAIQEAISEALASRTLQSRVEVATGQAAQAAKPADFEFFFKLNNEDPLKLFNGELEEEKLQQPRLLELVEEDAVLCRERPANEAVAGKNVLGQEVKAPLLNKSKTKAPLCGDNVIKNGNEYLTNVVQYGYVDVRGGKLCVHSPVALSDDKMEATLCLYPPASNGLTLSKENVTQMLSLLGIRFGTDEAAIEAALAAIKKTDARQVCEIIGRGQQECNGDDARFEHFFNVEKKAGAAKEDGTIDFRERGTIVNLKPDDAIGKKIPATLGRPQVNLLGETTPAKGGRDIDFRPGEHCELRDDGIFYATDEGALMVKDSLVHVTDVYQHQGDVDLQSGNLFHKKGAIEISGSVMSGFEVKANGHVIVKQNLENGKIVAGGDVVVGAGVIQPEDGVGHIHAMGNVTVKFAQNARILSYADINVGGSAMNCQFHAKGKVNITKGKGCIIGGVVKSSQEIRAKQIGSEAGSLTQIEIEIDPKRKKLLAETIAREEELLAKRQGDIEKLNQLIKEQKQLFESSREKAAIIVEGILYPGTTVKLLNVAQLVKEEKRRCKITLTPNRKLNFGNIE